MGQNMVGRVRMRVTAPAGTRIVLRHAEVLDRDGNIYFDNLRNARQTVTYIAKGNGTEEYAPHFTFMGFRYVKVEGYPGDGLPLDAFLGEVIHSDMEPAGEFECSDERVNRLQQNIRWGQRGNFVDVPTDCPQRDERLGWTGDAQVFIGTALYNYRGALFFTKWLRDLRAEQHPDGGVPFVIPDVVGGANSAAWADAATICPWTVYRYYGDERLLAEQYESMKKWVEYIRAQGDNEYLWNTGFHFGDWLGLDAKEDSYVGATPKDLIATAFYAHSARIVRDAARVLGYEEDAKIYEELHRNVVRAFREEFVTPAGRIAAPTQTAHVLALMFDLVDERVRPRVAKDLNDLVVENNYHLTTGFVGTPYLCFVLSDNGYHDTAVKLLLQDSYPGWLYSVSKGATTIWEHWDSIKPDGSFWSDNMNSFNHYAYGSIGEWLYKRLAGLDLDGAVPGFKRIRIEPRFAGRALTYARTAHRSMYGRIETGWRVDGDRVEVHAFIPPNTTAEVILRGARLADLQLDANGERAAGLPSVAPTVSRPGVPSDAPSCGFALPPGDLSVGEDDRGVTVTVCSGTYRFAYSIGQLLNVP
jgi:alpha-L-rhamnosidase